MTIQSFLQRIGALFFVTVLSFAIFTQFAHATVIIPCVPYTFLESYNVNNETLPALVEALTTEDGKPYIINTGPKKLRFQDTGKNTGSQSTLLLVDSKAVTTYYGSREEHVYTGRALVGAASLYQLAHQDTPRILYDSQTRPKQPDPTPFSISAEYDGKPITITGTISYKLREYDCPSGKEITGERTDAQKIDKTVAPKPVDTSSPVVPQDVQQKKSFWTIILQFLTSLKFW